MSKEPNERYGSTHKRTEYEGQHTHEKTSGFMRSAWSVVLTIGFLVLVLLLVWLYWPEGQTNPAPSGSPGNTIPTTPAPTQNVQ
jgi:cbb3-type cytochrome oxidase subunit 3